MLIPLLPIKLKPEIEEKRILRIAEQISSSKQNGKIISMTVFFSTCLAIHSYEQLVYAVIRSRAV